MPDLQSYYQDPNLQKAAGEAETAQTQATAYQSAASLLPQKLKEAINEKMDYNKDIIEQKNKAMAEYFQAPSQARAKYSDPGSEQYIFNPFQQEALVSQERAQAYQPYANLVDILGQRQGSLADIINAGTGAFQSQVTAQQGAADLANQSYQNLLGIADRLADAAYKEASLAKGGGGGTTINLGGLEGLDLSGGEEGTKILLQDPETGTIYQYDGYDDPDFIEDVGRGWKPPGVQVTNPTPTPSDKMRGVDVIDQPYG